MQTKKRKIDYGLVESFIVITQPYFGSTLVKKTKNSATTAAENYVLVTSLETATDSFGFFSTDFYVLNFQLLQRLLSEFNYLAKIFAMEDCALL